MKKLPVLVFFAVLLYLGYQQGFDKLGLPSLDPASTPSTSTPLAPDFEQVLAHAFENRISDLQITGEGRVDRTLADDNDGSRHQRFILELGTGQSLLVAHNIDLAPRISNLRTGDSVAFSGVYEWNDRGGVIHWTHRDPQGRHRDGWLEHGGRRYE